MADEFPIDVAKIVALFLQSVFYGLYLVSFGMCMYTMFVKRRSRHRLHSTFLAVAFFFFAFATLDVALLLYQVLYAFIWYHGPGGAVGEFSDISSWINAMKTVNYVAQTSIADGMLIYRCYVVYGGNWIIAAPLSVLWVAGLVVGVLTSYTEFTLHISALLNTQQLTPLITSIFAVTLVLNITATSLIVYKIWSIERQSRAAFAGTASSGTSSLRRAMEIIIESGLMYSVSVFVQVVVYFTSPNAVYALSDCVVQIIGIAFNLIIIRVHQGKTMEHTLFSRSSKFPSQFRFATRYTDETAITEMEEQINTDQPMVSFQDDTIP